MASPLPDDAPGYAHALHHEFGLSFQDLARRIDEVKVLAQETNGRVDRLELDAAEERGARSAVAKWQIASVVAAILASGAAWLAIALSSAPFP